MELITIENKIEKLGGYKENILLKGKHISKDQLEKIQELENLFRKKIPYSVKKFIARFGAITFNQEVEIVGTEKISVSNENNAVSVDNFYDFSGSEVSASNVLNRFSGNLPKGLLPICDGEPGDLVVLSMKDEDFESIYYWEHNLDRLTFLSSNFYQFITKLSNKAEVDVDTSGVK